MHAQGGTNGPLLSGCPLSRALHIITNDNLVWFFITHDAW
jgi:hypothetical protein